MSERFLTAYQAANLLGATPGTIAQWMRSGQLPFHCLPHGPRRISEKDLMDFLKNRSAEILDQTAPTEAAPAAVSPPADTPAKDTASQLVEAIVGDAVARRATDIHLESQPDGFALGLKIDGAMHQKPNFHRLPRQLALRLTARLKSLAGLDAAECRRPQSGTFRQSVADREVTIHLSTLPTLHGECLVGRLCDSDTAPPTQ
ncbi:MAG: ATPase, T2SS/T4P/T4SS family [Planctomycetota bacterium]|nr:ATPase, T2SS/T4P/T4SS family [Planctomycetota bacterium]